MYDKGILSRKYKLLSNINNKKLTKDFKDTSARKAIR